AEKSTTTSTVPSSVTTMEPLAPLTGLALEWIDVDLGFPILVFSSGSQTYVADKSGLVVSMDTGEIVLDIREKVLDGGERGLLGAAFHPSYADGSLLIVHYSDLVGNTQVSSFAVSENVADPQTERTILAIEQPAGNHNGGMVQFDSAGHLYVGLGDGGGSGDRYGNGQNLSSLLGSIVRLEVSDQAGYSIPPDNPFVGRADVAPEIWLWGLRNPWRFWIDEVTDSVFIGDVGQNQYEEVSIVSMADAGANLGWPITEGLHCFSPSSGCDSSGLTLPVVEVSHADAGSCSITGGIVYRGTAIPELAGTYFFSDYCGGYLRGFDLTNPDRVTDYTSQLGGPVGQVSSFGQGADGELYLATSQGVYRLVPER
ncbi:MAG: PQQ-dependent sugar dehydrogenase, partial [Acidimicrobiia bacterium]|nr:PQQ-dependent sugar dehydrogenase [Acidimicrobiia bacterium]